MEAMDKVKSMTEMKYFKPAAALLLGAKLFGVGKTLLVLGGGAAGYLLAKSMQDEPDCVPFMKNKDSQPDM